MRFVPNIDCFGSQHGNTHFLAHWELLAPLPPFTHRFFMNYEILRSPYSAVFVLFPTPGLEWARRRAYFNSWNPHTIFILIPLSREYA
jgi:hypothetical protein